jgi:GNAT superfamily N-acetyltransferase
MNDVELAALLRANIIAYKQLQVASSPLRGLALSGVWAFALPAQPEVLHQHRVLYESAQALAGALGALEDFYRGHGIPHWHVQVPSGDTEVEQLLARSGHSPGEIIPAMAISLADLPFGPPTLAVERTKKQDELALLNAEAFGRAKPTASHSRYSQTYPQIHVCLLREEGRVLSGGLAHDLGDITGIYMMATATDARRRGLGAQVLRALLADARDRGQRVAVLQATELGYPLYRQMGFRDLGAWTCWMRQALR